MAIIRKKEYKQMSKSAANEKLTDLKKELMKINTKKSMGAPPDSPGHVRELKKTITRLLQNLQSKQQEVGKKQ